MIDLSQVDLTKDQITDDQLAQLTPDQVSTATDLYPVGGLSRAIGVETPPPTLTSDNFTVENMVNFLEGIGTTGLTIDDRGVHEVTVTWTDENGDGYFYAKEDYNICDALWQHLEEIFGGNYGNN